MTRTLVTVEELKSRLITELRKFRELQGRTIGIIRPLRKPDEDGCNWSADFKVSCHEAFASPRTRRISGFIRFNSLAAYSHSRLGTDIFAKHSDPQVQHIVREARRQF